MNENSNANRKSLNTIALLSSKILMPAVLLIALIIMASLIHLEQFDIVSFLVSLILLGVMPILSIYLWSKHLGEIPGTISSNKKRVVPYIFSGICAFICCFLLIAIQAPAIYQYISVSITATIIVLLLCNLFTKVSVHLGTAGLFCSCCICLFFPWGLLSIPLLFLVAWSRLYLKKHTLMQVLLGSCIGIISPIIIFIIFCLN